MGDVYCLSNNSPGSFWNEFPTSHNVTQVSSTLSQIWNFQIVHSLKKQKRNKNKIIKAPITRKKKKRKEEKWHSNTVILFLLLFFLQSSVALRFCYLRLEIRCQRVDNMLWTICLKRDSFLTVNRRDCRIANLTMFPLCTVWIADKPFRHVFHVLSSPSDASLIFK